MCQRICKLVLFLVLAYPLLSWGAIAIDSSVSLGNSGTTVSATSYVSTGSNIVLVCGILQNSSTAPSGTYNGGSITFGSGTNAALGNPSYYVFIGTRAVGSGVTGNISITGGAGTSDIWGDCATYSGASQSGVPESGENGAETASNPYSPTTTTTADNAWLVSYAYDTDGTPSTAGASTVIRRTNSAAGIVQLFDTNGAKTPAGSHSLSITQGSGPSTYRIISLAPATGGAATTSSLSLIGVGK